MIDSLATAVSLPFNYPFPGHADALRSAVAGMPAGAARTAMGRESTSRNRPRPGHPSAQTGTLPPAVCGPPSCPPATS